MHFSRKAFSLHISCPDEALLFLQSREAPPLLLPEQGGFLQEAAGAELGDTKVVGGGCSGGT